MTKKQAIQYYGIQEALAKALGLKQSTVASWGEFPPEIQQVKLQTITRGRLKAEKSCYLPKPTTETRRQAA